MPNADTEAAPPRPFAGAPAVAVVLPPDGAALGPDGAAEVAEFAMLVRREPRELEVELGAPVRFAGADPGAGPRFLVGPAAAHPAILRYRPAPAAGAGLWLDRARQVLIADAPDLTGIAESFNLLRTLGMTGAAALAPEDCRDLDAAMARVTREVGWTYPAFGLRGLDWAAICARHAPNVRTAVDPLAAMQAWLAELQDAHTWVRPAPPPLPLPYALWVAPARATFTRVPLGTAAWAAGVRPGDTLEGEDTAGWLARTGAPAHSRPLVAGRRLLSGPAGVERAFVARAPDGGRRAWTEAPAPDPPFPLVRWTRLPSGAAYLRVEAWRADRDVDAAIDKAFGELAVAASLIVDLRANAGGNLNLACSFRDRFLREPTLLGSVRYSTGDGGLSEPQALIGEPAAEGRRWPGRVCFLTDALTYSASEDALLGLQGLPHVRVIGEPTGGGSGRPRTVRLLPGQVLTVSTALTYDRAGRCVEGAGIPVDERIVPDRFARDAPDLALRAAERME